MIRKLIQSVVILLIVLSVLGCQTKTSRNYQFMPNMYKAVGYETYQADSFFKDSMSARLPVIGSVARGHVPYDYPNTTEAYEAAKSNLKSPLESNQKNLDKGKELYSIFCISCHGPKGIAAESVLAKREKFEGVPNYKDRDITPGSIYHVIMHGKGNMGSHSSQLKSTERWQIVQYVLSLKNQ